MITKQHEIHRRRFGRNVGVAVTLVGMIVIVLGLTVVKLTNGDVAGALQGAAVQGGE